MFSSLLPPGRREGIIAAQAYTVTCIISYTAQGFREQPFQNEIEGLHHLGVLSLLSYVDVRINVHNEARLERIFVTERPQLTKISTTLEEGTLNIKDASKHYTACVSSFKPEQLALHQIFSKVFTSVWGFARETR